MNQLAESPEIRRHLGAGQIGAGEAAAHQVHDIAKISPFARRSVGIQPILMGREDPVEFLVGHLAVMGQLVFRAHWSTFKTYAQCPEARMLS